MKGSIANSASLSRRNFLAGPGGLGVAGLLGASSWAARAGGCDVLGNRSSRGTLLARGRA